MSKLFNSLPPFWQEPLFPLEQKINSIGSFLDSNLHLPSKDHIFSALSQRPQDIKVIIIGQDPYPNPTHAMGLAFSVPKETQPLPASLKNIFKELEQDLGVANTNGDLSPWRDQGVLLLNTILTTSPYSSLSHESIGWQEITQEVIRQSLPYSPVVLLWGNKAQKLSTLFNPDLVISSSHPSPLSARHSFFGSKPFSRANNLLVSAGKTPINWRT